MSFTTTSKVVSLCRSRRKFNVVQNNNFKVNTNLLRTINESEDTEISEDDELNAHVKKSKVNSDSVKWGGYKRWIVRKVKTVDKKKWIIFDHSVKNRRKSTLTEVKQDSQLYSKLKKYWSKQRKKYKR